MLPLVNLGGDPDEIFFADGMTAVLISELASIDSLKVISRTSMMRYRDRRDRSIPEIGSELGVDAIPDRAFEALERAVAGRSMLAAQWTDPDFDPLRSDPRFLRIVDRTGLWGDRLAAWGRWSETP